MLAPRTFLLIFRLVASLWPNCCTRTNHFLFIIDSISITSLAGAHKPKGGNSAGIFTLPELVPSLDPFPNW